MGCRSRLAHQSPEIPFKLARPRWFDGTALCIGSMGPDLGYSISSYLQIDTHEDWGILTVSVPLAAIFTIAARWVATTVAAQLPDLGLFRLHSWRAVSTRWPACWITATSLLIGIATHLLLDGFTHQRRWGPPLLGYDDVSLTLLGYRTGLASWLQLLGHTFGSLATIGLIWRIGRRRLIDGWYGTARVAAVRTFALSLSQRVLFWVVIAAGLVAGVAWGWNGERVEQFTRPMVAIACAAVLAHATRVTSPRPLCNN